MKMVCTALVMVILGLYTPGFSFAETPETNPLLPDLQLPANGDIVQPPSPPDPSRMPGTIEGTGTHFEIADSKYLNIVLDSSEEITVRLESAPEMVIMDIRPSAEVSATQITMGGFKPLMTYYKYEDDYHNLTEFTTDQAGKYAYKQDLSVPHHVFIQPRKSTKFIKDDSTGGDCISIGTWDWTTKTCTLTTDLTESIQIDNNNITLDGNGHVITGTYTGAGVALSGISFNIRNNITIKNLTVKKFYHGISISWADNCTISNNIVRDNSTNGIRIGSANYNIFENNNVFSNKEGGIRLSSANYNTLTGNIISNNRWGGLIFNNKNRHNTVTWNMLEENESDDLYINPYDNTYCDDVIQNNIGSGGRPIKYFNSSVNLENEVLSQLILCNADYSSINNVIVEASANLRNNGVYFINTDYSSITNTTSSNNYWGFYLRNSRNNAFENNTAVNNNYAIYVFGDGSGNNILTGNNASYNVNWSITIYSSNNTLTNNTVSNNGGGIMISSFYGNTFVTGNILRDNTVSDNYYGIFINNSSNGTFISNDVSHNSHYGIRMSKSNNNNVTDNTVQENGEFDLYVESYFDVPFADSYCNNTIQNNIGSGGRPIKYVNSAASIDGEVLSELILCNADYSRINNVSVNGSNTLKNNGILIIKTDYSSLTNSTSSNNYYGIYLFQSNNNAISESSIANNSPYGIWMYQSNSNVLKDNVLLDNSSDWMNQSNNNSFIRNTESQYRIFVDTSSNNTFKQNTVYSIGLRYSSNNNIFQGNEIVGMSLSNSDNNTITENTIGSQLSVAYSNNTHVYRNNFINSRAYLYGGSGNLFNLAKPIGGNYWSDFDTPAEGCYDNDQDGFCDAPYFIKDWYNNITGADYLPWVRQTGWNPPSDTTPPTTTIMLSGIPGNNDWYTSDVQAILTANDNEGGSGVKEIHYTVDGAETVVPVSTASFTVSAEGEHSISYFAVDNAANRETAHPLTVKIDKTLPMIPSLIASPGMLWPPNHKMVDVLIDGSATDTGAGIDSIIITVMDEYGIYNMTVPGFGSMVQLEAWREGTDRDGRHYTITAVVTDKAGNRSTAVTEALVPHDMR